MLRWNWRTRKLRPSRKARGIYGEGEEAGKYYHCMNCGFVCSLDRDNLGGSSDQDGLVLENYSDTVYESPLGNGYAILDGVIEHFQTVLSLDSFGNIKEPEEHWEAEKVSGCPLCGSRNWRGDY